MTRPVPMTLAVADRATAGPEPTGRAVLALVNAGNGNKTPRHGSASEGFVTRGRTGNQYVDTVDVDKSPRHGSANEGFVATGAER